MKLKKKDFPISFSYGRIFVRSGSGGICEGGRGMREAETRIRRFLLLQFLLSKGSIDGRGNSGGGARM